MRSPIPGVRDPLSCAHVAHSNGLMFVMRDALIAHYRHMFVYETNERRGSDVTRFFGQAI